MPMLRLIDMTAIEVTDKQAAALTKVLTNPKVQTVTIGGRDIPTNTILGIDVVERPTFGEKVPAKKPEAKPRKSMKDTMIDMGLDMSWMQRRDPVDVPAYKRKRKSN